MSGKEFPIRTDFGPRNLATPRGGFNGLSLMLRYDGVLGWWNTETPNSEHHISWYWVLGVRCQVSGEEIQRVKPETSVIFYNSLITIS